jgi:hypothetical protein
MVNPAGSNNPPMEVGTFGQAHLLGLRMHNGALVSARPAHRMNLGVAMPFAKPEPAEIDQFG